MAFSIQVLAAIGGLSIGVGTLALAKAWLLAWLWVDK
jgi:hypothetical protein